MNDLLTTRPIDRQANLTVLRARPMLAAILLGAVAAVAPGLALAQDSEPRVKVNDEKIEVLEQIQFASGKAVIQPASFSLVDELAEVVKANTDRVSGIRVEGHTDSTGDSVINAQISDQRAKAVVDALVSRGIDQGILIGRGFGATRPVADNGTAEGRAQNRRVEFVILTADQLAQAKDNSMARLVHVEGTVQTKPEGQAEFTDGRKNQALANGTLVRVVGAGSLAEIVLKDDTTLVLEDGGELLLGAPTDPATHNAELTLSKGGLWVHLTELALGKVLAVKLPHAYAAMDIGWNYFWAGDDKSVLAAYTGRPLWFWGAGKTGKAAQIQPGKMVLGDTTGLAAPKAVLGKPTWVSAAAAVFSGSGTQVGEWSAVDGARNYRVAFVSRTTERDVSTSDTVLQAGPLPGGSYQMSVQAIDADGVPGMRSDMKVVRFHAVSGDRPLVMGDDNTVTLAAGSQLRAADGTVCSVDRSPFAALLTLVKPGVQTVTCKTGRSSSGSFKVTVAALELIPVMAAARSPLLVDDRVDFELSSSAPIPPGLRIEVSGVPVQMSGSRFPADDVHHAWASFVPDGDPKGAVVKVIRDDQEIVHTVVEGPVSLR